MPPVPVLTVHPAAEPSDLGDRLAALARQVEDAGSGSLAIQSGDGSDPPAVPALVIQHEGAGAIRYLALPEGPEERPFREALAGRTDGAGGDLPDLGDLRSPAEVTVLIAAACPHCPGAVRAALRLAMASRLVTVNVIDAQRFPEIAERFGAQSVPQTVFDGGLAVTGVRPAGELAGYLRDRGTEEHGARLFLSLVEQKRLADAAAAVAVEGGPAHFAAAWRRSTTGARIGLMLVAEHVLEHAGSALDHAVDGLLPALAATDAALRGDTADLLGQIGHPSAVPALERLCDDPSADVAEIAADALDDIRAKATGGGA